MFNRSANSPRILIFSLRNIFGKALFRCAHFEFEDLISQMDSAELLAPKADPSGFRHGLAKRVAFHLSSLIQASRDPRRRQNTNCLWQSVAQREMRL
jgi:hypothetical protein